MYFYSPDCADLQASVTGSVPKQEGGPETKKPATGMAAGFSTESIKNLYHVTTAAIFRWI